MASNRIAVGAAKEGSGLAAEHLGTDCHDRKCSKQMFGILCYSADAKFVRLSKGVAVRRDNSPVVETGLLHEHVR